MPRLHALLSNLAATPPSAATEPQGGAIAMTRNDYAETSADEFFPAGGPRPVVWLVVISGV
jgi:hypothetical protein